MKKTPEEQAATIQKKMGETYRAAAKSQAIVFNTIGAAVMELLTREDTVSIEGIVDLLRGAADESWGIDEVRAQAALEAIDQARNRSLPD